MYEIIYKTDDGEEISFEYCNTYEEAKKRLRYFNIFVWNCGMDGEFNIKKTLDKY